MVVPKINVLKCKINFIQMIINCLNKFQKKIFLNLSKELQLFKLLHKNTISHSTVTSVAVSSRSVLIDDDLIKFYEKFFYCLVSIWREPMEDVDAVVSTGIGVGGCFILNSLIVIQFAKVFAPNIELELACCCARASFCS